MSTPTCSFISNGNATTLTNFSLYNPIASVQPTGIWYYFLIKNDGFTDTLSNISLSSGFTWYMCLAANGGSGGLQSKFYSFGGGGGGGGQALNVILDTSITNIPITQIVLQPISDDTTKLTSFTCVSPFTTTSPTTNSTTGISISAGTYFLYPGLPGGNGGITIGNGGGGGSQNNYEPDSKSPDIGVIGAAGGGGTVPGPYFTGYFSNTKQTSSDYTYTNNFAQYTTASGLSGGNIKINFSDGITYNSYQTIGYGSSIGGNGSSTHSPGSAGNGAFVMFYCTPNR
jgi:hypothetical protein